MTSLGQRVAEQARGVGKSSEWRRIAALPRRVLDLASVPDLTPVWRIDDHGCPGCDLCVDAHGEPQEVRLRPIQSAALLEAEQFGLFAPIGVGGGKTLVCLLLADAMQAKRVVYLVKPRLRDQLVASDIPRYGRHFRLPLDRVTIATYWELSNADQGDVLDRVQPDLLIADEAHLLNGQSARTRRVFGADGYLRNHPECRYVPLSGSMIDDSVRNITHHADRALRSQAPVPTSYREAEDWARGLDPIDKLKDKKPLAPGALLELCGPEVRTEEAARLVDELTERGEELTNSEMARELARRVCGRRIVETPGVVATEEAFACDLIIRAYRVEVPPAVKKALDELRRTWKVGDEELRDAKDLARYARQLACGFYYKWAWPGGVKDEEWSDARAGWNGACGRITRRGRKGLDSKELVRRAAVRGELDDEAQAAWEAWKLVMKRPQPPTETVWIDRDFLFDDVLRWCAQCETDGVPGIVWFRSKAVEGRFRELGVPTFAAGAVGVDRLKIPYMALSIDALTEGLNLQHHFVRNRVVTSPAKSKTWEQMLGRTHRQGQQAEEVTADVDQHDQSLRQAFANALQKARLAQASLRQQQKLCYAERVGFDA